MTALRVSTPRWAATRTSFDSLLERVATLRLSVDEDELLRDTHWDLGQDARLREDVRFRTTPWGRWIPAAGYLANDALFAQLHREPRSKPNIEIALTELDRLVKRRCFFCPGDPRFVLEAGAIRLSARELTNQPLVEHEVGDLEKYVTHLPIHSLRAAAASLPAGEWGRRAQEEVVETIGWLRVSTGQRLNRRMFVARIEGHSMDDGRSGLVDGGYAVFELWPPTFDSPINALVRGAFNDPETGSYAVKKFVSDARDKKGRHRLVKLVSLNPDKTRFPDIPLARATDDQVTIVARVVSPLAADQYARRPRPVRRPGRRDLASSESVAEIVENLASHTERFFESLPSDGDVAVAEARSSWCAELVCLEPETGGVHIEVGPLLGLWSFVKQLRVRGAGWETTVLASNLRLRATRIAVAAGSGPWNWQAVGFEDDVDVDFSALAVGPPSVESVTVFRVDVAGVGRQIASTVLSMGQHYRLLVPGAVMASVADKPPAIPVGAGWSIWDIDLSSALAAQELMSLRALGLEVGEADARLEWVLVAPAAWGVSPRGMPFPRFLPDPAPVVAIDGPSTDDNAAATLFLHGPDGNQSLPLPAGRPHLARLIGLVPGRYSVMVLHDRTAIPPERLTFEVIERSPSGPIARWEVNAKGALAVSKPGTVSVLPAQDLAAFGPPAAEASPDLSITAPPGWPVRVSWRELAEDTVSATHADANGDVDTHPILAATHERRVRRSVGDLMLDFGELGAAVLRHERRPTPATIRTRIDELVVGRGGTVKRLASAGAYADLVPIWYDPVCSALGYDLDAAPINVEGEPPAHVAAHRLLHTERHGFAIERHPVRILLLVEDLSVSLSDSVLAWIDEVCACEQLRDVLVSDGLRWAGHRRTSRLAPRVWDLAAVAKDADECMAFLRVASEGV